jgi:hypothetical protein
MAVETHYSAPPLAIPHDNPTTAEGDSFFSTQFTGTPFEVAIANWYYRRGYDVSNIRLKPPIDNYPWFAIVSKQDGDGEYTTFRVGVVAKDMPGGASIVDKHKQVAEWVEGGNGGELWVTSVKSSNDSTVTYEAEILRLRSPSTPKRWEQKSKESFTVAR